MASTMAPDVGMLVGIPIRRGLLDGLLDFLPGLETSAFERQRFEGLPPGFNQVQVGGVGRLEDELPTWIGQVEEQDIDGSMHGQMI